MAKLEIDYSLPYEEANKKYGHNGYFMSKDQYEQKQAEIASNKKIGLSPEAAQVYAEANAVKNGTTPEEEAAKNQAAINRDNYPDVDDTRAIGATKEELDYMLQNGKISRAAYDKQTADLNTPEVQEEMARGEKKADETVWDSSNRDKASANNTANTALTDSVSDAVTPKKDDPPEVVEDKNKYNKAMMSIWDAYRAGEISKETAGYFTIDAIATLAKNLGRSIGNVGAQFSGGTIDNGHDESKWGQRQNALLNEEIGKETESLGGAASRKAESENIANLEARVRAEYEPQMLNLEIKNLENEVKKSGIDITKAENSQALIEHIKQDPDYENKPLKMLLVGFLSQTGVGGAVNSGASALEKLALLKGK